MHGGRTILERILELEEQYPLERRRMLGRDVLEMHEFPKSKRDEVACQGKCKLAQFQ